MSVLVYVVVLFIVINLANSVSGWGIAPSGAILSLGLVARDGAPVLSEEDECIWNQILLKGFRCSIFFVFFLFIIFGFVCGALGFEARIPLGLRITELITPCAAVKVCGATSQAF